MKWLKRLSAFTERMRRKGGARGKVRELTRGQRGRFEEFWSEICIDAESPAQKTTASLENIYNFGRQFLASFEPKTFGKNNPLRLDISRSEHESPVALQLSMTDLFFHEVQVKTRVFRKKPRGSWRGCHY